MKELRATLQHGRDLSGGNPGGDTMGERKVPRLDRKKKTMLTSVSTSPADTSPAPQGKGRGKRGLERPLQAHIGRQLQAVYNQVLEEKVPDRFIQLLRELEAKQDDKS
jgi:hypothetical protein